MKSGWFLLALSALGLFSSMSILITSVVKKGYPVYFVLLGLSIVLLAVYGGQTIAHRATLPTPTLGIWFVVLLIGILSALANLAQFNAMATAPNPGLVTAVIALQASIIAVVSIKVFHAHLNALQIAGIVCGFIAVVLLALGANQTKQVSLKATSKTLAHTPTQQN